MEETGTTMTIEELSTLVCVHHPMDPEKTHAIGDTKESSDLNKLISALLMNYSPGDISTMQEKYTTCGALEQLNVKNPNDLKIIKAIEMAYERLYAQKRLGRPLWVKKKKGKLSFQARVNAMGEPKALSEEDTATYMGCDGEAPQRVKNAYKFIKEVVEIGFGHREIKNEEERNKLFFILGMGALMNKFAEHNAELIDGYRELLLTYLYSNKGPCPDYILTFTARNFVMEVASAIFPGVEIHINKEPK